MVAPALQIEHVTKRFGGVLALDDTELTIRAGEVHALLGENGSGKSTLVKVITGYHAPQSGARLRLWGREVPLPIIRASDHGIAVIHQDLGLASEMTVADNIGVSSGYGTKAMLPIRFRSERRRCAQALREVGIDLSLDRRISELSPAERAGVAIARSIRLLEERGRRQVFVLDEPTSYLSRPESERVIDLMRAVARRGSSVIFISHRLGEVLDVADQITVLRDGRVVATAAGSDATQDSLVTAMLGYGLDSYYPERANQPLGDPVLEVEGLHGQLVAALSLEGRGGEVLGITGLAGMGHEELPYLLGGVTTPQSGIVRVHGEPTLGLEPRELAARGVVLVPGNRHRDGGWQLGSAQENITLPVLKRFVSKGVLRPAAERRTSQQLMTQFGVRPPDPFRTLNSFSGGNQQKIVLAKWLSLQPRLLLLHEPTQGVDAGAKRDILEFIVKAARRGSTVLLCSGDYEQIEQVCDRVLVLYDGRIVVSLEGHEISEERIAIAAQEG